MALGKLVVDLSLEYASYTKGLDKASFQAEQFEKNVKKRIDGAVNGVSNSLKGLALGAAAGVGAVLSVDAAFTKLANTFQELDRTAKSAAQLGILVEDLSRLEFAAALSGVGADQLRDTLKDLAKNAVEASKGTQAQADAFELIGVSVTDAQGKVKSLTDLLPQVADAFAGFEDGATKSELAMKIFGEQGLRLIPLLNQGAEGIRAMGLEADALGVTMSAETAANAELFNDNLARLQGTITGLTQSLAQELLPALNSILTPLLEGIKASGSFSDAIGALARVEIFGSDDLGEKQKRLSEIRQEIEVLSEKASRGDLADGLFGAIVELSGPFDLLIDTQSDLNSLKAQEAILTKQIADATGQTQEKDKASLEARRKEIDAKKEALEAQKKADEESLKALEKKKAEEQKVFEDLAKKAENDAKRRQEQSAKEADTEIKRRLADQEKLIESLNQKLEKDFQLKIESSQLDSQFKKSAADFGKSIGASIQSAFKGGQGPAQGFAESLQGYLLNTVIQPSLDLINRNGGGKQDINSSVSAGLTVAVENLEQVGANLQKSLGVGGLEKVLSSLNVDVAGASDPKVFAQSVLASGAESLGLSVSALQQTLGGGLNSVDPRRFVAELANAIGASVSAAIDPNGGGTFYQIGNLTSAATRRAGNFQNGQASGELGSDAAEIGRFIQNQINSIVSLVGGFERVGALVNLEAFAGSAGDRFSIRVGAEFDDRLIAALEEVNFSFSDGDFDQVAQEISEKLIVGIARGYTTSSETINSAIDSAAAAFNVGEISFSEFLQRVEDAKSITEAFGGLYNQFSSIIQAVAGSGDVSRLVAPLGGIEAAASAIAEFQNRFQGESTKLLDVETQLRIEFDGLTETLTRSRDELFRYAEGLDLNNDQQLSLYQNIIRNSDVFDRYFSLLERQQEGLLSIAQTFGDSATQLQVLESKLEKFFGNDGPLNPDLTGIRIDFRNSDPAELVDLYKFFVDAGDDFYASSLREIVPVYKQYIDLIDENKVAIDEFLALIGGNSTQLRDSGAGLRSILQAVSDFAGVDVDLSNLPRSEQSFREFFIENFSDVSLPSSLLNPLAVAAKDYFDKIEQQSNDVTSALEEAFSKETEILERRLEATEKLRNELQSAFSRESGLLSSTADGFKNLATTIGEFRESLYLTELGGQTLTQQTQAARSRLSDLSTRAAAGDQDALREIATASSDYLQALQSTAGSAAEYQRAVADVNKILLQAQSDTLDAEQVTRAQLTALESLVSGQLDLAAQNRAVEEILDDINAQGEDTAGLQARLNELQQLQNELLGSIEENTSGLASAIQNFAAFFDTTQTNEIAARYLALLESSGTATIQAAPQTMDGAPSLNQQQAQQLSTPTNNTQLTATQVNDLLVELREIHDSLVAGHAAIAGHTNKTARILERFDDGDAFLTRVVT